jgi:EAL domain-containing protein (putative c-di-GMP-specific phosphodiesterase class I)
MNGVSATPSPQPSPAFRALILEDHDFQRRAGVQLLKLCGATEVIEAINGSQAISTIEEQTSPIDVLVCDLNMPGTDGLAFLRYLGENNHGASVILASALDPSIMRTAEIMAKSYGITIIGAIEKPVSRAKLFPLILRHFSRTLGHQRPALELMPVDDVRRGIERKEFIPFYQPKVDVKNLSLVGVEALMRWRHPERGLIPPGAFIPVMEQNGLIASVTFDLVELALTQVREWKSIGLNVPVAINISVESLTDTELPARLEAMTEAAKLPTSTLTIEVTETVAMTDLGHSLETLARCRMRGFALSIDDYGTGFSSMTQLTRLPLSELKIDQTFVTGSAKEPLLYTLIETSVMMAKRLGLKTVAEGVETAEDWDVIARLDCDVGQGYHIAKPMPGDGLADWYTGWLGNVGKK